MRYNVHMKCEPGCTCKRHAGKGVPRDPAVRAKISATKMGHEVSEATRKKIGAASRGRKQSAEQIEARATRQRTHGMWRTPTYRSWDGMKQRCLNLNANGYADYGGRGITVCDRWLDFANFLADMGERPSLAHSIDRKDNDGPYSADNCRWATDSEQQRNRPNFNPNKRGKP